MYTVHTKNTGNKIKTFIHTLTVKFFQRPVRADWIIFEISFLTSGKSDSLGGVNSTLAYFTNVCKFGFTVFITAIVIEQKSVMRYYIVTIRKSIK